MSQRSLEIKVGVFILAAAAILIALAMAIGDLSIGRTWPVHVDYGFAGSIHTGAPVRISGIQMGRVSKRELLDGERRDEDDRPLLVRLTLAMEERAQGILRDDVELHIGTAGVLGESYVDAITGTMRGAPVEPGAVLRGVDPPRTDLLLARAYVFLETISEIIDEEGDAARELLSALNRLAGLADEIAGDEPERIAELLDDAGSALEDLAHLSAAARAQLDGGDLDVILSEGRASVTELRREIPEILRSLRGASDDLRAAGALLAQLDEDDLASARDALARFDAAGARLESIAEDVHEMVERVEDGEGTLGALLTDDQVYEDLSELLYDLRANPWKILWRR